jgi:phosphatidylserine/phosphatidylglycerophosphate/cardiolipin synthase-like enzyme
VYSLSIFDAASAAATEDRVVSLSTLTDTIARAGSVVVAAYTLNSRQAMVRALLDAVGHGARVELVLSGEGEAYAVGQNRSLTERFCGSLVEINGHKECRRGNLHIVFSTVPLHMKAAVIDRGAGGVFLSDTNFSKAGLVLQIDQSYAAAVERSVIGDPQNIGVLTTTKPASLTMEAALIGRAHHSLIVATESFDGNNAVYDAIVAAIGRRVRVDVIVGSNEYEQSGSAEPALLAPLGSQATVRVSNANEKFAVVDGQSAWIGSTNATSTMNETADQIDWGYLTNDPLVIRAILRRTGLAGDSR